MASSKYFKEVKDGACLKLRPLELVVSVKVTGDCACGAGGGGFVVGSSEL
jgi:hypothetical protein